MLEKVVGKGTAVPLDVLTLGRRDKNLSENLLEDLREEAGRMDAAANEEEIVTQNDEDAQKHHRQHRDKEHHRAPQVHHRRTCTLELSVWVARCHLSRGQDSSVPHVLTSICVRSAMPYGNICTKTITSSIA